jgi:hypothetical protein
MSSQETTSSQRKKEVSAAAVAPQGLAAHPLAASGGQFPPTAAGAAADAAPAPVSRTSAGADRPGSGLFSEGRRDHCHAMDPGGHPGLGVSADARGTASRPGGGRAVLRGAGCARGRRRRGAPAAGRRVESGPAAVGAVGGAAAESGVGATAESELIGLTRVLPIEATRFRAGLDPAARATGLQQRASRRRRRARIRARALSRAARRPRCLRLVRSTNSLS